MFYRRQGGSRELTRGLRANQVPHTEGGDHCTAAVLCNMTLMHFLLEVAPHPHPSGGYGQGGSGVDKVRSAEPSVSDVMYPSEIVSFKIKKQPVT